MRWTMPNVKVAAALVLLVAAETVIAAGGGGGGGGGGRQRGAATATAADRQLGTAVSSDKSSQTPATGAERQRDAAAVYGDGASPRTPAAVPCSSCLAHESIRSLSLELIKLSILNKLGMQRPPEFGGRRPPKVPTDLPPLQDLMRKYNNDRSSSVMVMPHIRHKSHHYESSGDGGGGFGSDNMQSDEAASYAAAAAASIVDSGGGGGGGDDEDDDYHVKTHKLIAFAQPHPTTPKLKGHHLLYFTFSEQTGQRRITEAILWLYKKRSDLVAEDAVITIDVHRIHPGTNHQSFVSSIKRVLNTTEPDWVPIDLQKRMSDWFRTSDGAKNLTLLVNAYYTTKNMTHAKMPFVTDARKRDDMAEIPKLEVHTREDRRSRARRNAASGLTCNETSAEPRCCRYPLTVDFEEFGWHWIIAPKKYEANYCTGTCDPMLFHKYPHTHLVQMTKLGTVSCCAPRKMSAITMLYYDVNYNIVYGVLPGMVVERCGCS